MPNIPHSQEVGSAIKSLRKEVRSAVKAINQQAAKRLARGDYAGAQALIETAQSVSVFDGEVAALQARWREVRSVGKKKYGTKAAVTPLWEYYQPILQAITTLDGAATRREIEAELEGKIDGKLKEGDFAPNSRGTPRWKVMISRAHKHMIREGFITDGHGFKWEITRKGTQAASKATKKKDSNG